MACGCKVRRGRRPRGPRSAVTRGPDPRALPPLTATTSRARARERRPAAGLQRLQGVRDARLVQGLPRLRDELRRVQELLLHHRELLVLVLLHLRQLRHGLRVLPVERPGPGPGGDGARTDRAPEGMMMTPRRSS